MNVGQPDFFKRLDARLKDVGFPRRLENVSALAFDSRRRAILYPARFVDENFDFFGRTMTGTHRTAAALEALRAATDRELGEALGQKYVAKAFSRRPQKRARWKWCTT